MIKLTAEDYRRMAFLVEDKSYDFSSSTPIFRFMQCLTTMTEKQGYLLRMHN